jgi:LPXTG-motif cell wall-anchored protein
MNGEALLAQLNPLKPPVPVPHTPLWIYALGLAVLLAAAVGVWLWRRRRRIVPRTRRIDLVAAARQTLENLPFDDSKAAVYGLEEAMAVLADRLGEADRKAWETLRADLARYKYRKTVPPIDETTRRAMQRIAKAALKKAKR